jgi:hypothetical protein
MSDLYLKDSKGRYQQVCIQLLDMSCGPACKLGVRWPPDRFLKRIIEWQAMLA